MKNQLAASASIVVLVALAAGAAQAQSPAPAGKDTTTVSDIVVTAQKREQRLQDVPIEVQSLPASKLQAAGVADIKDLQILTPGLTVTSTSSEAITSIRIRGVGTVGDNPGLEDSVGVVIDGVYRPRNGVSFGDLGELDRVEVLEGPQGTTFGENTTAGVVNILTKAPSFTFGSAGEVTFGNYNAVGGSASVTGPIIADKLAGRIYIADRQRDGFYNVNTAGGPRVDTHDQDQKFRTARGQLLWTPSDVLSVRAIVDYTKRDENCCVAVQTETGSTGALINALAPGGAGVATTADPFSRKAYANRSTQQTIEEKGAQVQADLDLKSINSKLTSITSVRGWYGKFGQDIDYSGADIFYRNPNGGYETRFSTLTEELRLGGSNKTFDWLAGFYFSDEKLTQNTAYNLGAAYTPYVSLLLTSGLSSGFVPCLSGTISGNIPLCNGPNFATGAATADNYRQDANSYSFFTNDTWKILPGLDLTAGVRWNHITKTLNTHYSNLGTNGAACGGILGNYAAGKLTYLGLTAAQQQQAVAVSCLNFVDPYFANLSTQQKQQEDNASYTAKLAYRWSPEILTYASFAHGFKDGGFNLDRFATTTGTKTGSAVGGVVPVSDTSFPAETTDSYELGAKTTLLNGKLLINITAFDQEYKHFQLNAFNGLAFTVDSIPTLTSKGVDGQFQWISPLRGLSFNAGFTYADTKYGHFTAADLTSPADFYGAGAPGFGVSRLPGARASFAPLWSETIGMNLDRRLNESFRILMSLDAKSLSAYNTGSDLDPTKIQGAYTLVNGRIGFGAANNMWRIEFWANNLTDVHYRQVVFDAPLQPDTFDAFLGAPRTLGVTLRAKY